jgi:hypothetical protein
MVRERKHQQLRSWMEQAISSGIPELKSFVAGIERDYDAVHAALRLPWSQGIDSGQGEQAEARSKESCMVVRALRSYGNGFCTTPSSRGLLDWRR